MYERVEKLFSHTFMADAAAKQSKALDPAITQKALWHTLRAQCNCAYWHGVFGGLYLNYLRFAMHREILEAEKLLAREPQISFLGPIHIDSDYPTFPTAYDTDSGMLVARPKVHWVLDPTTAQIVSAGSLEKTVDVIDVLARRFEAYHATMKDEDKQSGSGEIASIHDIQEYAPHGWREGFGYDRCRRGCFGDRIFKTAPSLDSLARVDYSAEADLASNPWTLRINNDRVRLERTDGVWKRKKTFSFDEEKFRTSEMHRGKARQIVVSGQLSSRIRSSGCLPEMPPTDTIFFRTASIASWRTNSSSTGFRRRKWLTNGPALRLS